MTELMARPLLNLHWPQLAGFVQPLAGEYAGRRTLLERVPFMSGYGVEIAMLVDVFELAGLSAMAQVDLGSRRHRNSSDAALGQMAAQVYLALLSRIERHGLGMMTVDASYELTQFARDGQSFVPTTTDVGVIERPPMADVGGVPEPGDGHPAMSLTVLMNAGPWLPVPPRGYGGIEAVVATLVPELRRVGVRVVLATVGTSTLPADGYVRTLPEGRLSQVARPYNQVSGIAHAHMQAVVRALREEQRIDVVHDHLEVVGPAVLAAMGEQAPPTLQTLHWDLAKHPDFYSSFDGRGRVAFAAVSRAQLDRAPANLREPDPRRRPAGGAGPGDLDVDPAPHVLVLARITPDKGQDIALRVCREAGVPLVLAGPVAGIDDPRRARTPAGGGRPGADRTPGRGVLPRPRGSPPRRRPRALGGRRQR